MLDRVFLVYVRNHRNGINILKIVVIIIDIFAANIYSLDSRIYIIDLCPY